MPQRFELEYVGADGARHTPVMVHRAVLGSLERFIGILIEHAAGAFPLWLSPEQVRVLPITDDHRPYAQEVVDRLRRAAIRAHADMRNEKTGRKIRDAAVAKVPYALVIGDREVADRSVAVRKRGEGDQGSLPLEEFVSLAIAEIARKS